MTAKTPLYGIPYPEGKDLVANAPQQLKDLATGVEKACKTIDDRSTPAGSTPVVRDTPANLNKATGVTGQTGWTTNDSTPWYWDGAKWIQSALQTPVTTLQTTVSKLPAIQAGSGHGITNSNGVFLHRYTPPTGKTGHPDAIFITYNAQAMPGDAIFRPVVWGDIEDTMFQIRWSRSDTDSWVNDAQGLDYFYLLIWN